MKVIGLIIALLMVSGVVYADQTGTTWWHSHSYTDNDSYVDRYSEFQPKPNMELGLGADVIVYEFDGLLKDVGFDAIEAQTRWDMNNGGDFQAYGVVKCNAWRVVKRLLGI